MKPTIISIVIAALLIGGASFYAIRSSGNDGDKSPGNNVTTADGKQVVEISAKGGYLPRVNTAKANTPTVLKVRTNGTFDCSASLTIPSLGYRKILPPSGETLIEVPPQEPGSVLRGLCSMGMYNFEVRFN